MTDFEVALSKIAIGHHIGFVTVSDEGYKIVRGIRRVTVLCLGGFRTQLDGLVRFADIVEIAIPSLGVHATREFAGAVPSGKSTRRPGSSSGNLNILKG